MTTFENSVLINKPIAEVYAFLEDMSNHGQLMPDNIENWEATKDEASFAIKNMTKLSLIVNNRIENLEITAVPKEKAPIAIDLKWRLTPQSDNTTQATFAINADLNMMLKMIASGPLQKLVDYQLKRVSEVLA